jgi:ATP-dependent Zn protease
MVTEYGMSDRLGLVSYERPRQAMFLPESFSSAKNYSEAKAAQIDDEVSRFVDEAHQRVREILRSGEPSSMIWPVSFRRRKVCREMNSGRCCRPPHR